MKRLLVFILLSLSLTWGLPAHAASKGVAGGGSSNGTVATGGTGTTVAGNAAINNLTGGPAMLPHHYAKLAQILAPGASVVHENILCIGDSTTGGVGASGTTTFCTQLGNKMIQHGIPVSTDAFWGYFHGPTIAGLATASWNTSNSNTSMGGSSASASSSGAGTLAFTTAQPEDTFVIWYIKCSSCGTLSYNIDGGSGTTINTNNGSDAIASSTISAGSVAIHTLNITYSSGGSVNILAEGAYNSTISQVVIWNAGWEGSTTANWASTSKAWSPENACDSFAPDLAIINLMINDVENSVSLSTYESNLEGLISYCQTAGTDDILMMTSNHMPTTGGANPTEATQLTYANAVKVVAAATSNSGGTVSGVPVADEFSNLVSYAYTNTYLKYVYSPGSYSNDLHLNANGYEYFARDLYQILVPGVDGNNNHYLSSGTLSSCGTGPTLVGGANAGRITIGTGGATACAYTFNIAYGVAPACWANDETTAEAVYTTASTTTLTIKGTLNASDKITYGCTGLPN